MLLILECDLLELLLFLFILSRRYFKGEWERMKNFTLVIHCILIHFHVASLTYAAGQRL